MESISRKKRNPLPEAAGWGVGEGAAGSLSLIQKSKGELSFILELSGGLNKRARVVDPNDMGDFTGEFKGASTYGAAQIQGPLGLGFDMRK